MSLKGKYSPPYPVDLFGEVTLTFKRMLTQEWEELSEQIKNDRITAENTAINIEMKSDRPADRQEARTRMRDHFEGSITMSRVMRESADTAKGIRRLLAFALIEKEQAEWLELLAPVDVNAIVEQIVYLPVVKPVDPPKLPPQSEASNGGSDQSNETNPTGDVTPQTSSTSSPELTPVN